MNIYQPSIVMQTILIDTNTGSLIVHGTHGAGTQPPAAGGGMRWILDRVYFDSSGDSRALHFATDDLGNEGELLSITGWVADDRAVALVVDGIPAPGAALPALTEKMVQSMYINFAAFDFNNVFDLGGGALTYPIKFPPAPTDSFYVSDMVYVDIGEGIDITSGSAFPGPRYPFLQETFKTPIPYKKSAGGDLGVGIAWMGEESTALGAAKRNVIEIQLTARKFR